MSALENQEDAAAELAEEKRILAATLDLLHDVEAERDRLREERDSMQRLCIAIQWAGSGAWVMTCLNEFVEL
jgi:hypothetical protein